MKNNPRVSFIFPYRWLTKDKEFLGDNLIKQIKKYLGAEGAEELEMVSAYSVLFSVQAYEPEKIKISKTNLQKLLKPLFPNAKLIKIFKKYEQHPSQTMHPIVDFNLFY